MRSPNFHTTASPPPIRVQQSTLYLRELRVPKKRGVRSQSPPSSPDPLTLSRARAHRPRTSASNPFASSDKTRARSRPRRTRRRPRALERGVIRASSALHVVQTRRPPVAGLGVNLTVVVVVVVAPSSSVAIARVDVTARLQPQNNPRRDVTRPPQHTSRTFVPYAHQLKPDHTTRTTIEGWPRWKSRHRRSVSLIVDARSPRRHARRPLQRREHERAQRPRLERRRRVLLSPRRPRRDRRE